MLAGADEVISGCEIDVKEIQCVNGSDECVFSIKSSRELKQIF